MKNNCYVHVLMAAGAAFLVLASPSMAMDKGERHGKGDWKNEEKSLGLNEEQRTKMKTIREESRAKQEALKTDLKAKHEAMRQELDAPKADRAKAEAMVKEISALEQQMGLNRVDMVFKIREILTPEQYQKLQALHEKKRAEMKERHGKKKFNGMKE